jgi:hypothetical protein
MPKEEEAISMGAGLSHVEVASNERNEDGIEHIVNKFMENVYTLASIRLRHVAMNLVVRSQPRNFFYLIDSLVTLS